MTAITAISPPLRFKGFGVSDSARFRRFLALFPSLISSMTTMGLANLKKGDATGTMPYGGHF